MKKLFANIKTYHLFILGLVILFMAQIPTFILGIDSIVPYHDQLDGEIIAYIYQAKYLFSGEDIIPEFLNGVSKTSLTPPAPLGVLLFCVFSPFTAYTVMQIMGQVFAYIGMFYLLNRMTENKYISLVVALLYTFIPFLPVYGLAQYGIPMLLLCFWNLYEGKYCKLSYGYVALYTGMSSLVLIGFSWLILGIVLAVIFIFSQKFKEQYKLMGAFLAMLIIYIAENISLITQVLGFENGFVSHKEEYVLNALPFLPQFTAYFKAPSSHAPDHHAGIIPIVVCAVILAFITIKYISEQNKKFLKWILLDLILVAICCAVAALWDTSFVISLREKIGALSSFQLNRVMWVTPALWYIALALSLSVIWNMRTIFRYIAGVFSLIMLALLGFDCLKSSFVKPCVQEILLPSYETISWSDYLAIGVMEQVEEYIYKEDGLSIDEYKVVSLGIDPSAALFHGFYCVDGYSNNYPLTYKHEFRKVIAPELARSDYLTSYYDEWGNRCYLFNAQIPGYFNVEKNSAWYNDLQIDTKALKELDCDYILSAAYIVNAEELHLTWMGENTFETENSYYQIFIYKIS